MALLTISRGRYQEALADLDRAIALDENYASFFAEPGKTYRQIEHIKEALTDFDRAIVLDEKFDWYRYCRAQIYMFTGQTDACESELEAATELAQLTLRNMQYNRNTPSYRLVASNHVRHHLAAGKLVEAELQYGQLISSCSSLPRFQEGVIDSTVFSTIQPSNELAQRILIQQQTRIAELQQYSTE